MAMLKSDPQQRVKDYIWGAKIIFRVILCLQHFKNKYCYKWLKNWYQYWPKLELITAFCKGGPTYMSGGAMAPPKILKIF